MLKVPKWIFPIVFEGYPEEWIEKWSCQALGIPSARYYGVEFSLNISHHFNSSPTQNPHPQFANSFKVSFSSLIPPVAILLLWNSNPCQGKPIFEKYLSGTLWTAKLPQSNLKWWISFSNILFKIAHGLQPVTRQRCGGCIKLPICSSHCSSLIYNPQ